MEDHEPERSPEPQLAEAHRIGEPASCKRAHLLGDRLPARRDVVPLEHGVAERDRRGGLDELQPVPVVGPDASFAAATLTVPHPTRVKSITQFVSHVLPPSSENACSHRGVGVVTPDHVKRTRIGRPR